MKENDVNLLKHAYMLKHMYDGIVIRNPYYGLTMTGFDGECMILKPAQKESNDNDLFKKMSKFEL